MQTLCVQKNTRRTCIEHLMCITPLNSFFNMYWSTHIKITPHQGRLYRSVENPCMAHVPFEFLSFNSTTHTNWSSNLPRPTLRKEFSSSIASFPSWITFQYVHGVVLGVWNIQTGFCWSPSLKSFYSLRQNFNHMPHLSHLYLLALISSTPTISTLTSNSLKLHIQLKYEFCDLDIDILLWYHMMWWGFSSFLLISYPCP